MFGDLLVYGCCDKLIAEYNLGLTELCEMSKISLIDINSVFWANDLNLLIDKDTLHPNTLGHQLVFEMVLASLI